MGDCYEKHLESMKQLANHTGAKVVSFNYRGVGDSAKITANSAADLISDGKAMFDHLVKQGLNKENILLYGHSMGGGVAAEIAQRTPAFWSHFDRILIFHI